MRNRDNIRKKVLLEKQMETVQKQGISSDE